MGNRMTLFGDDAFNVLRDNIEENSVDIIVTDPPYGLDHMRKAWDKELPDENLWREAYKVLKPGCFAFVFSAPRADLFAKMVWDLKGAGFKIDFSPMMHTFLTGFPKANRVVTQKDYKNKEIIYEGCLDNAFLGFQPKPAMEMIIVAMKPLSEKNTLSQVAKDGKGVTLLNECKINGKFMSNIVSSDSGYLVGYDDYFSVDDWFKEKHGELVDTFPFLVLPKPSTAEKEKGCEALEAKQKYNPKIPRDGKCFDIFTKRDESGEVLNPKKKNHHPTVKPVKLLSFLIELASRKGDLVLDMFNGSGSTGIAAKITDRGYIGIDLNAEYIEISKARISAWGEDNGTN